ncbi:MAG: AraC family transcriptional regulator [Bacteroidota bacterium]
MLTVPKRLLDLPNVTILNHIKGGYLIKKELSEPVLARTSYLSMHAITMVTAGTQHLRTDGGAVYEVKASNMAFLQKGMYTVSDLMKLENGFEVYLIYVDDAYLSSIIPDLTPLVPTKKPSTIYPTLTVPPVVEHYLKSYEALPQVLFERQPALAEIKFREFFLLMDAILPPGELATRLNALLKTPVGNLRQVMERHFDKPLTIGDYAYLTGRSESTFRREFKQRFGTSPRQWLIEKRLSKAHELLKESRQDAVADIALQVGYEHVSHFIQAFKRQYGCTPGDFQGAVFSKG